MVCSLSAKDHPCEVSGVTISLGATKFQFCGILCIRSCSPLVQERITCAVHQDEPGVSVGVMALCRKSVLPLIHGFLGWVEYLGILKAPPIWSDLPMPTRRGRTRSQHEPGLDFVLQGRTQRPVSTKSTGKNDSKS
eukprot:scaffold24644_cov122-Cylindrotheca_fusiformis.AAC.2